MGNEKVCSGDICPECKDGKIALMSSYISEATKDQEPYEGGKIEGEQEICEVDFTSIYFEACEECGKIYDKWFEEARPSSSLERIEEANVEVLAEAVHKAYCQYQLDNGKEYWTKGDYSKLDDATKEIDRYTVRAVLKAIKAEIDKQAEE